MISKLVTAQIIVLLWALLKLTNVQTLFELFFITTLSFIFLFSIQAAKFIQNERSRYSDQFIIVFSEVDEE